jgi:hypothetical protein
VIGEHHLALRIEQHPVMVGRVRRTLHANLKTGKSLQIHTEQPVMLVRLHTSRTAGSGHASQVQPHWKYGCDGKIWLKKGLVHPSSTTPSAPGKISHGH